MIRPMTKFKILVCGGRDFHNRLAMNSVLAEYRTEYGTTGLIIIEGAAKGADKLAHLWAVANSIENWRFPADGNRYKNAAGPIRNKQMLDEGVPDLVIAFPGGNGTANMIKQARSRNFPVRVVECDKLSDSERDDTELNNILKWCIT